MPNLATALKVEVARLARKEIRNEVAALKKASTQHRSQLTALRKQVDLLERTLKKVARTPSSQASASADAPAEEGAPLRFRPQGLVSHRKRLGLTRAAFGKLLGVTDQAMYKWETGQSRPRREQLQAISTVRKMGRLEARARLDAAG